MVDFERPWKILTFKPFPVSSWLLSIICYANVLFMKVLLGDIWDTNVLVNWFIWDSGVIYLYGRPSFLLASETVSFLEVASVFFEGVILLCWAISTFSTCSAVGGLNTFTMFFPFLPTSGVIALWLCWITLLPFKPMRVNWSFASYEDFEGCSLSWERRDGIWFSMVDFRDLELKLTSLAFKGIV